MPPVLSAISARDRLIVALDLPTATQALTLLDSLESQALWVKVGLELYLAAGPSLLEVLRARELRIFLDLKLHDIPNTVAGAVRSLAGSGASLLTVHASGGGPMLQAAAEATHAAGSHAPMLLGVTVLTSTDAPTLHATGIPGTPAQQVERLARLAIASGLRGLVCSPQEAAALTTLPVPTLPPETIPAAPLSTPLLVVPGIRPTDAAAGDQRRIATPAAALHAGASMLVVGRPITQASSPASALAAILAEMDAATTASSTPVSGERL